MSDNLTPAQVKAVTALLECSTLDGAAKQAGVNVRTLYRWLRQSDFSAALHEAEGESLANLSRRILALGDCAVDALADVLKSPNQPGASNKRMAASDIISRLLQLRELVDLESRVAALEAAKNDTTKPNQTT